jgi:hypothetical protein
MIRGPDRADERDPRAVAVLAVIGGHAWPQALDGGFVSVDVFFVISGFPIHPNPARTWVLVRELLCPTRAADLSGGCGRRRPRDRDGRLVPAAGALAALKAP